MLAPIIVYQCVHNYCSSTRRVLHWNCGQVIITISIIMTIIIIIIISIIIITIIIITIIIIFIITIIIITIIIIVLGYRASEDCHCNDTFLDLNCHNNQVIDSLRGGGDASVPRLHPRLSPHAIANEKCIVDFSLGGMHDSYNGSSRTDFNLTLGYPSIYPPIYSFIHTSTSTHLLIHPSIHYNLFHFVVFATHFLSSRAAFDQTYDSMIMIQSE